MSNDDVAEKFFELATPVFGTRAVELADVAMNIEKVSDMEALLSNLQAC
jgi:hypothetical protein